MQSHPVTTLPSTEGAHGVWQAQITGRYRAVTVHQLVMAWWLFQARHITRRQLRVYFAAHEMAERRRYTKSEPGRGSGGGDRKPLYGLDEIKSLVGGRGSKTADAALSADVRTLARLGLVTISDHAIEFAVSIDQIALDDVSGFWSLFEQMPHPRRTVPMPRRTCRALAAGLPAAVMAMMIALMIRSLFWHKARQSYRVDGRTKCSWIAGTFGLSRRAVTDARARLIELGWLIELDAPQWELNHWGQRYAINVDAYARDHQQGEEQGVSPASTSGAESASPRPDNPPESSSPCLNSSSSPSGNLTTRKPAPFGGAGTAATGGSRKKKPSDRLKEPSLKNVTDEDLRDTRRLLELHRQAVEAGHPVGGEGGRLDFLALAERARSCGSSPPRLFVWLLRNRRFDFIAMANEEAAADRLRAWRHGERTIGRGGESRGSGPVYLRKAPEAQDIELTDDDRIVLACLQTAGKHHGVDPFSLARQVKGWTRDRWDTAHAAYRQKECDRWAAR